MGLSVFSQLANLNAAHALVADDLKTPSCFHCPQLPKLGWCFDDRTNPVVIGGGLENERFKRGMYERDNLKIHFGGGDHDITGGRWSSAGSGAEPEL